ncbi:MAG: LOW QUALITY PROTEIN: 5-methyltetrahydropteroyltriglutamate--homocysteine S-methyltransferase, partial [Olpidium bornovanus]
RELCIITAALNRGRDAVKEELAANKKSIDARKVSTRIHNAAVAKRMKDIRSDMFHRQKDFSSRQSIQRAALKLPKFPTTPIGSFPQTKEVRLERFRVKKGEISTKEYQDFLKRETDRCIRFQDEVGLDVLVHGEFERNDMVEFFGENLDGYAFTQNGWVASYGTRCVKPPIIYGDVSRKCAITVPMSSYAQSLTEKLMKGMLTGPITCLQWSFVRDDQPRRDTAFQLALAMRDEVLDLERAGIRVIQVDEPAIREGLPLRKSDQPEYLKWSVDAFLLTTSGVRNETQIHTHMCYSEFNEIFNAIQRMVCRHVFGLCIPGRSLANERGVRTLDADVTTIESSKSDLKVLGACGEYKNELGPGLYDIHSPRVPTVDEMLVRVREMLKYIPASNLWINPDCGLKTRDWK